MTRGTSTWTTGMAVTALLALPVTGWGQNTAPQSPLGQGTSQSSESQETAAHQHRLALEHLHEAHTELAGLQDEALTAAAQSRIAELKRALSTLQHTDTTTGASPPAETLAAVDRLLTELLGPKASGTSNRQGPVGTAGGSAPPLVEGHTKAVLQKVRTHLAAYAGAAGSVEAAMPDGATARGPRSSPSPPTGESAAASTSPTDPTPTPTGRASTGEPHVPAPPTHTPRPDDAAGAQTSAPPLDAERVKLHLTAARNALAEMTRLPAAAEISGASRSQVSQLITDFNEMIGNETAWQKALDKVKATLHTILAAPKDDRAAPDAAAPDVVGTSGRSGLDPEIRAKLVEFRSHLEAFEAAVTAGARAVGTVSAHDAEPMDPQSAAESRDGFAAVRSPLAAAASGGNAPQQALRGAAGSTTYPGAPADRPPAAGLDASRQSAAVTRADADADAAHVDALRHIEAIEALLAAAPSTDRATVARTDGAPDPVGTSGTTTPAGPAAAGEPGLDAAQITEIREHLRQLRQLLQHAR